MVLINLQILGVVAAAVAALVDIESIVFSGPILSTTGSILAARSFRRDRAIGFYMGLAAPTMSVLCFSLICGLEWSPRVAEVPVGTLVVLFAAVHINLGVAALIEAHRVKDRRRPLQYSILTLLVLMLVLSVFLGIVRTGWQGAIALAALISFGTAEGYVLWRFHAGRKSEVHEPMDWQI